MDRIIARMKHLKRRFGCDHRGVFATTYMELSRVLRRSLKESESWRFKNYLYTEAAYFADYYFRTLRRWRRGDRVPPAWRIALGTARDRSVLGAQDMLLGINAHVQNDMPFVVAALGVRTRKGETRKPDHDLVNQTLNDAYERVVAAVRARFDPSLGFTNPEGVFVDDLAGLEMVRAWREGVWRNAERLTNAESPEEWDEVARSIERSAAMWAGGIALVEVPGYRADRDAYCEARLAGLG
jgi:hypothetical protein